MPTRCSLSDSCLPRFKTRKGEVMKLKLFYEGDSVIVTSERAAKAWARGHLAGKRVFETPTERGWQYWSSKDPEDDEVPVTVLVLA